MKVFLYILLASVLVTGCSNAHLASKGSVTHVVPVVYEYHLNVAEGKSESKTLNDLDTYIYQNIKSLIKLDIELKVYSKEAGFLSDRAQELLLSLGVAPSKILVSTHNDSKKIGFSLIAKKFEVQVPVCESVKILVFGGDQFGCATDSMRWASIVNPEKMLPQQSRNQLMIPQE